MITKASERKKICLLINSLESGGAEKIVLSISKYYKNAGYECFLVLLENSVFYELPEDIKLISLMGHNSNIPNIFKLFLLPYQAIKLKRVLTEFNILYVQSHTYRANYVNVLCKKIGSNHIAHIVNHGIISVYKRLGIKGLMNQSLIRYLYPGSDKIILLSKGMYLDLKKNIKVNDLNVRIINNPYEVDKIIELSSENITKDEFYFSEGKKYIVSIGSLIKLKRNIDLILAYNEFQKRNPDFEVIYIGDGIEKKNLINLVKELKLENRIHFIGRINNPYKYLSRSFAFVLNSSNEAFPNVIVEALACGCPVISSDCYSGPREILTISKELNFVTDKIELGDFGILYPVGNINLLIESLEKITKDQNLYTYYKDNGLNQAKQFDVKKIMIKYLELLK